jgi:RNA polymerase sigma-70 factor (ECF subfamily)
VYRDAGPALWRTIYAYAGGRAAVADDAVAEAFARAIERADQIREPVAWLYRTAFRLAAEDLRRGELDRELEPQVVAAAGLGNLIPALRQLSPAQRAAVVLHYEADLAVRDVARQMGTSVAAVKVHLFRGRRRLRELLGGEENDHD